jgi:hypothetical protein
MFFTGPIRHGSMAANCGVFATGGTMVLLTHDGPIFLLFGRSSVRMCFFTLWTLLMGDRERVGSRIFVEV